MISDRSFGIAIIAVDPCSSILEFGRHWLGFDCSFQMPELPFHIDNTSAADWASIRAFHVFVVASMVYAVAASHKDYCLGRCEHVFAADGAITICRALDAAMGVLNGY